MKKYLIAIFALATLFASCNGGQNKKDINKSNNNTNTMNTQSDETMKIAMAYMDAMGKGDMETMVSLMHDDMVWQNEGDKNMPWIGPWKGKKTILEDFMPLFGGNFKTTKWETEDAFANGDTAAFFGRMVGLATKSNQETKEFSWALRVKVKDGKIILWNWFEDSFEVSRAYHNR